jgi:hypothetical protein
MWLLTSFINGCLGAGATAASIYFNLPPGWACLVGLLTGVAVAVIAALPSLLASA